MRTTLHSQSRALSVAFALALLPLSAHADLITNGNFSSTCGSGSFCTYGAGNSIDIPGWTVGSGSVDLITGYWQSPPGGGHSVDLDGFFQVGDLFTSFATTVGASYIVTFVLSGNPDGGVPLKNVEVSAGDFSGVFSFDTALEGNSHADMGWIEESFQFTATGAVTILDFQSLGAPESAYGPVIGNVSAAAVPEPASLAILGLGFAGLGWIRRRRAA